ncbi:MAG: 5-formyltetrahydrofolate cyclo-ligase [Polyangiaceae bacterium]|nr:5-formyltetrahydrofolate cyclo-ligase [Polyangiaceae bacterium]
MAEVSEDDKRQLAVRVKRQLRLRMRQLRMALPAARLAERSARIVQALAALGEFDGARSIALFYPMSERHEVDLRELDARARAAGKRVFYPFMDPTEGGFRTGFRRVTSLESLVDRGRGFREPSDGDVAEAGDVDLVVVPALAATEQGDRLGYGLGFYDSTLSDVRPPATAVVVVFDFQLVVELPREPRDVRCDLVVSDERVLRVEA